MGGFILPAVAQLTSTLPPSYLCNLFAPSRFTETGVITGPLPSLCLQTETAVNGSRRTIFSRRSSPFYTPKTAPLGRRNTVRALIHGLNVDWSAQVVHLNVVDPDSSGRRTARIRRLFGLLCLLVLVLFLPPFITGL